MLGVTYELVFSVIVEEFRWERLSESAKTALGISKRNALFRFLLGLAIIYKKRHEQ